ncbi:lasso peptide biosynthesis B2 protein [soil metagenome]
MPEASLSKSVHMVAVRDDVVILDVSADRYSCLAGAAPMLAFPRPGIVSADADILRELAAANLVVSGNPILDRRAPVAPRAELPLRTNSSGLKCFDTALRTLAVTAVFRRRALAQLVAGAHETSRPTTPARLDRVAARASAYRAVLPYLPFEGLCLQRAYQLRQVLAADGLGVDWVFGVRTWPFFAHCWLQHDDLVIADRLERVRAFTPIAVF